MSRPGSDDEFERDTTLQQRLPSDLRHSILTATGSAFLDALARAALIPQCTERLFSIYSYLATEIVARWMSFAPEHGSTLHHTISILASIARIFPFARHLRPFAKDILSRTQSGGPYLQDVGDADAGVMLLAIFRLLSTEPEWFSEIVKPTLLSQFFSHKSPAIRYLAIQCLCFVMRFADALEGKLVRAYVGDGSVHGNWEGREIDFRLLRALEETRWLELQKNFGAVQVIVNQTPDFWDRQINGTDLSASTASVGGVLLPRSSTLLTESSSFIQTSTAKRNLQMLGRSLLEQKPTLVVGRTGSGKTSLIRECARVLNRLQSMITLHLNEQTDAKSLLGIYASSEAGNGFVWKPGVLTKAVQEGRWVVIEDIDKAPADILGVLRPVIETGELFLPSRKKRIKPGDGFRVFATITLSSRSNRSSIGKHAWLVNERLWNIVKAQQYPSDEIQELLQYRYPRIRPLLIDMLQAHDLINEAYANDASFRAVQSRLPSLRDLLKWCDRTNRRVELQNLDLANGMPEQTKIDILKDAIECYAAYHSDMDIYHAIVQRIAQSLNVSPQQKEHVLSNEAFHISGDRSRVIIGRSILLKQGMRRSELSKKINFAMTAQAQKTMDSIASAAANAEPVLLVGETGVGKTTQVQHIANLVGQQLTVVNLSQQSEASDLLGGLKPITTRSLIIPLVDQFSILFDDTFSNKRNEKFQIAISKAITKENWQRLVLLYQEAIQMAEKSLSKSFEAAEPPNEGQSAKRRKLVTRYGPLRERWAEFSAKLSHVRTQVERGNKNHAFAFVEGRLVQAVKSGEWLLLDEINLASADTLDHIVGLLSNSHNGKPSLLLAEAGNIEQIIAHPNFRIFAAMNPATDTGKKDLAPGVRSHFTEIYVQPGDTDLRDLVKIIEVYLGSLLSSDRRAAQDLAEAYLQLKRLNEQHQLTDGAGDVPHFSIRSLVRCLLYMIQHSATHGLRRSMYEGFAMSFFTMLSIDSENLALPLVRHHLLANIKNVPSFLKTRPKAAFDEKRYVAFEHHLVPRGPKMIALQPHYIRTASVERNLRNLARAASMRRFPILLQGPTSAGKTSMVEFLAKFTGNQFVRVNNHEHTDLQEYLGSYATGNDGKLEFREGVLVEALRKGHWIVLDELNLAPSDVLEALNRLLDDNRELLIPESQEIVRPHAGFMLFATQNPAGLYGGRKRLSRAFRNRFLELHFDEIPENELEKILRERTQRAPTFCSKIVEVYKSLSLRRQSSRLFESRNSFATLRDLFRWAARPVHDYQQLATHGFMLLAERVRDPTEREVVKTTIEQTLKVKINEDELYSVEAVPEVLRNDSTVVWTLAMRRLFVLVSEALKNNEPVLLVGETGCGKTQICQTVAQASGKTLNIYNAHSNTETGDLIGSQRPTRQRSELADALLTSFAQLYAARDGSQAIIDVDIDSLIAEFFKMDTSGLEPSAVENTKRAIAAYQSLFTWSDGSLVRSMKAGEHFLLDEISLADDSVLERLNSVLEPARSILLAEKGPDENNVVANVGFQFLATMNPGGDYGKRELSPALRNRLTEIWVPPLSQSSDILPILQGKLGGRGFEIAQPMLDFAVWFRDNMQNSVTSTIPLRSLLAWATFMTAASHLDIHAAFLHGASMIYIDSLGANPAGLMGPHAGDLDAARRLCLEELQRVVNFDVLSLYSELPQLSLTASQITIGPFSLQRTNTNKPDSNLVFDIPTTLRNTMRIARALQMSRPILLEGNPGVGKTAIVTALATVVGKSLTRINLSDQTDLMDLFGADAPSENEKLGRFSWRDGPLLQAMQTGGWVLLDEMNLASQSVLEGLNSCLDHRQEIYIAELDKSFTCHPGFTLFAAQNPHHQGGGRKGLPASFVNRFTVVYADAFEQEDLLLICQKQRPQISEETLTTVVGTIYDCHQLVSKSPQFSSGGPWELNLRDVNRWLDLVEEYTTLPPSHHFDSLVTQRFRSSAATSMMDRLCEEHLRREPGPSLYHNLTGQVFQLGTSFLFRDANLHHVTSSQTIPAHKLPFARSLITAINHKWPVILAGPSGCGKTSLIRSIAALSGANVTEFSMNADIDTMDLVGGFEQHDTERDILAIQQRTCSVLLDSICNTIPHRENLDMMNMLFTSYETCMLPGISAEKLASIVDGLSRISNKFCPIQEELKKTISQPGSSGFTWNDGVLVDALQSGSWLVLDNANLCSPSVLDRLNSLLEPDGVFAVSEQHNSGNAQRVIHPHPSFRIFLTMDPKYGELSRAMRNRSLEIFVDHGLENVHTTCVPTYPLSGDMYRIRPLTECLNNTELSAASGILQPFIGNLSMTDTKLVSTQIHNLTDNDEMIQAFQVEVNSLGFMLPAMRDIWPDVLKASSESTTWVERYGPLDLQSQPQLFMYNDGLIRTLNDRRNFTNMQTAARQYFSELVRCHLQAALEQTSEAASRINLQDMTILQQSISAGRSRLSGRKDNFIPKIHGFLTDMAMRLCPHQSWSTTPQTVTNMSSVLQLANDFFDFFNRLSFEPEVFQAYLQIAHDLLQTLNVHDTSLANILAQALSHFVHRDQLQFGRSLHRMWPVWKPTTPSTVAQLDAQILIEQLIARFDDAARCLFDRREELANIRVRLIEACDYIAHDKNATNTVSMFETAVDGIAQKVAQDQSHAGRLILSFEWLVRRLVLQGKRIGELQFQRLSLFTNSKPVVPDRDSGLVSDGLRRLAYLNGGEVDGSARVVTRLSQELASVSSAPLSSLNYVQSELNEFAAAICTHTSDVFADEAYSILRYVHRLLSSILDCHKEFFSDEACVCLASHEHVNFDRLSSLGESALRESQALQVGSFATIYRLHLLPVVVSLASRDLPSLPSVGASLINVCIAALKLLVPDKALDPAVHPTLVLQRHQKHVAEIQAQIIHYEKFQKKLTDQEDSMILVMLRDDLDRLGPAPEVPVVVRPATPDMKLIQQVFSIVLENVLSSSHMDTITSYLATMSDNVDQFLDACTAIQTTVSRAIERFSGLNRAYDDITKPVQWLLATFSLGTKLATDGVSADRPTAIASIFDHAPLLGGNPVNVTDKLPERIASERRIDVRWLESVQFQGHVEHVSMCLNPTILNDFLCVVDKMYIDWKTRLARGQAEAETDSKYYAYRGQDDESQENDESEIAELFPTYDSDDRQEPGTKTSKYDGRTTAIRIAELHDNLCNPSTTDKAMGNYILKLLGAYNDLGPRIQTGSSRSLLPGVFLQMERSIIEMTRRDTASGLNIYIDSDVVESRKLVELVFTIKSRFREIHDKWPEHAVPVEVLDYSDELLAFKINEPITKLLTKTEKLFDIVSQWQSVASRELSVSDLTAALTNMIVSWRRLELSSWSRLLEVEQKKHEDDADAWYFIAYEAVLYNTRLVVEQVDDTTTYCQELSRTLEEFLRLTTLGQYSVRLRLLKTFRDTLKSLAQNDKRLLPICHCVAGVLYHYSRYEPDVRLALSAGHAQLAKDMSEQIKLASWKDTNVRSLRDSARRSHYKLFKIVKKYRKLLAQPVTTLKSPDLDTGFKPTLQPAVSIARSDAETLDTALRFCATEVDDWEFRPDRLTNPLGAATSMRKLYASLNTGANFADEIAAFREDIAVSARDLRRETPQTLTEENTSQVRHLKERKRRLMAETMKAINQMGIRRNLSTSELGKQASVSMILTYSTDLDSTVEPETARAANMAFHQTLDDMYGVRKAFTEHSQDLTEGEVRRAIGLLEGLLFTNVNQRADLGAAASDLQELHSVHQLLMNMQSMSTDSVTHLHSGVVFKQQWITKCLAWLPLILETSCQILKFQSTHGNFDTSDLVQALEEEMLELRKFKSALQQQRALPDGLSTLERDDHIETIETELGLFGNLLRQWKLEQPNISYLLDQIIPWTKPFILANGHANGVLKGDLTALDNAITRCLDSVFVAMQNLASASPVQPTTIEDPGWLARAHSHFHTSFRSLQLGLLTNQIRDIVSRLHQLPANHLKTGISLLNVASPVIEQYFLIGRHIYQLQLRTHYELCQLSAFLTKSFLTLINEGFCTPREPASGEEQQSGKLESGTGLGEGEGAEDISKGVGEDEDLSELAQAATERQTQDQEMQKENDAVDMGADDLEGEMGSGDERQSDDNDNDGSESESDDMMNEETGSVDDLDPSAVDEKLWDDMRTESEKDDKEMKSNKQKGEKSDEQTAKDDGAKEDVGEDLEGMEENDGDNEDQDGTENDAQERPEAENLDPHLQQEEALELPEDMKLTGDDGKDELSDTDMDDLSDIDEMDQPAPEMVDKPDSDHMDEHQDDRTDISESGGQDDIDGEGKAQDDEIVEDQNTVEEDDPQNGFDQRDDEMQYDLDDQDGGDTGTANQRRDNANDEQDEDQSGRNDREEVANQEQTQAGKASDQEQTGDTARGTLEKGVGRDDRQQHVQEDALKNLADILEQYHQRREILTASEQRQNGELEQDVDMAEADFEHLGDDDQGADAQALGAASADQVQRLDESKAIEHHDGGDSDRDLPMPEDKNDSDLELPESIVDRFNRLQNQTHQPKEADSGAIIHDGRRERRQQQPDPEFEISDEDSEGDDVHVESELQLLDISSTSETDGAALWTYCSNQTHRLSLLLTEQLRLILAPTTATKLRGDFRTGKRLNIKRIIPYIASGYKRDKIWMRRSVPSKRNYQIMIAVDDSKSMSESGADLLAFETLAMLSKSLSMLEVGDLSIVGFGDQEHIRVAHAFGQPFTGAESGANVFRTFTFQQRGTDVRRLLRQSISLFETARLQSSGGGGQDSNLWQLQLIVSDGHCSDHDAIRRLLRAARERRIMVVFVLVDAGPESIVDQLEARVEPVDPADPGGPTTVKTRRYLEGFPFQYYVVVREVTDLPGVLARVLRGWFESVVEVG